MDGIEYMIAIINDIGLTSLVLIVALTILYFAVFFKK
jgi:hypothetical protein